MLSPFSAIVKTLDISVTATASASTALPSVGSQVRIVNEGPNVCFIHITSGSAIATLPATSSPVNTCTPIMPGDTSLSIPDTGVYNISAICRTGQTARLSVAVGEGI
jgi:hypothetical protein